jgi:hypothetical protein
MTVRKALRRTHHLGMSRWEFFSRAAARYLDELDAESVTCQIDRAIFACVTLVASVMTTFVTFFASQALLNRGTMKYGVSLSSPHALRILIGAALYMAVCALLVAPGAPTPYGGRHHLPGLLFILPIR